MDTRTLSRLFSVRAVPTMLGNRRLVLSAAAFALTTIVGIWWFGNVLYSVALVLVALAHFWTIMKWHPRLDALSLAVHYSLLAVTVISVLLFVWRGVGPAADVVATLTSFLRYAVVHGPGWGLLVFLGVATSTIGVAVALLLPAAPSDAHKGDAVAAGFFAGSIVIFACDYTISNPMGHVGATRPEQARGFVFASGLDDLGYPFVLHVLILLAIALYRWRCERLGGRAVGHDLHQT